MKITELLGEATEYDPLPEVFMELHKLDGDKDILTVKVMEGEETPYYYKGDGTMEAFIRIRE